MKLPRAVIAIWLAAKRMIAVFSQRICVEVILCVTLPLHRRVEEILFAGVWKH
jgi:hypothetical protein